MLCYAMLCCAVLCDAMRCYAMLCYAMLCYAMLREGARRPRFIAQLGAAAQPDGGDA
jgi:hypothetical protein